MSSRPLYRAVLPAVLVFSAVFSILSLPFFLHHSQPESGSEDSIIQRNFRYVLVNQNRDLTVRYIGAAMVFSVVTGIGTIELRRRQQQRQNQDRAVNENLAAPLSLTADSHPSVYLPAALDPDLDLPSANDPFSFELAAFPADQDTTTALLTSSPAPEPIIELTEECATCRIWVQHPPRRLLAIQVGEEFYSFFRLFPNQETALQMALQLSSQQPVAITPVEQGYGVWVWQAELELEAVSSAV